MGGRYFRIKEKAKKMNEKKAPGTMKLPQTFCTNKDYVVLTLSRPGLAFIVQFILVDRSGVHHYLGMLSSDREKSKLQVNTI